MICSALSVHFSTLDPSMQILKTGEGWFYRVGLALPCTKGVEKLSRTQTFSLLQTNSSQKWCGFFQALLGYV